MWSSNTHPADPANVAAVVERALAAAPRCGPTVVVAVDGPSGAGKTTVATGVADALRCHLISMDEIYPGWDGLAESVGLLATQVLEPLAQGRTAAYRRWDWTEHRWGETIAVPATDRLVIEGAGCSVGRAGTFAALRVWVEADPATRIRRAIDRDGDTYRPHWDRWARQEAALFAADGTRARADLELATSPRPAPGAPGRARRAATPPPGPSARPRAGSP